MNKNISSKIQTYQAELERQSSLNAVVHDLSQNLPEAAGKTGPLADFILAIKDNMNLVDTPTTCASKILAGYISPYTATAVQRLIDAGGQIVAKTNLDEFAMGSSTEYSSFGPTRNPHDQQLVPGGSSGGSAVAVAAGLVDGALGSDTGGSVRQPAAFCGIYGLKPTYGRVSRYGLVAFASSLDQIGVFAKTTNDTAKLFEVIAGNDPADSTTAREAVEPFQYAEDQARQLVVGLPGEYDQEGIDTGIREHYHRVIDLLKSEGIRVKNVSLPHTKYGIPTYYVLATAEASSNLARFDGVRYGTRIQHDGSLESLYRDSRSLGFGPEVQRRIMLGTYVLSAGYMDKYYSRAQKVRRLIQKDFSEVFKQVDLLFTPTTPTYPFPIGGKVDDPLTMYLSDVFTVPVNLAGIPGLSIPVGYSDNGLPAGMQLAANYFQEAKLFQLSRFLEERLTN